MKVKYIRWSTASQSGARQSLNNHKYDAIIQEQVSGSIPFAKRPQGSLLISMIKEGKVKDLFCEELTRLGRGSFDILSTLNLCEQNGVTVHIENMNLSSSINGKANPIFKMFTHIMSIMAEHERELILERTEMGKIAARNRGVRFGRRPGTNERKLDFLQKDRSKKILKYLKEDYPVREIAQLAKCSTTTVQKVKRVAAETKVLSII